LRYFDQSLLLLLDDAMRDRSLPLSSLLLPLVPVAVGLDVSLRLLEPIDTSFNTNCDEPAALAADPLVSDPAVAAEEPVPVVPVVPLTESALCRHPVTVTF
jgi:hypothetical protein